MIAGALLSVAALSLLLGVVSGMGFSRTWLGLTLGGMIAGLAAALSAVFGATDWECRSAYSLADESFHLRLDGTSALFLALFCAACVEACPQGAITQTGDHRMAVRRREDLALGAAGKEQVRLAAALDEKLRKLFGRSLRLRQVSARGCAACEADTNVLGTIGRDLGRFGIQFVTSPRHADGLLITGPVTKGMELALQKTYAAVAAPKIVIAVGACAIAGGPFVGHSQIHNGASAIVPVDLFVPGCPPHPLTILDGLLRLLDRLGEKS